MALKFTSFADLLQIGGNSGVGGGIGRKLNAHARLADPTDARLLFPLPPGNVSSGDAVHDGGCMQSQYPCGLQDGDPTVPTVPTDLNGIGCSASSCDDWAAHADRVIGIGDSLGQVHELPSNISVLDAGDLAVTLDEIADAVLTPQPAIWDPDASALPADQMVWRVLAAAYYTHHLSCPTCIAAGRGLQYGSRCGPGLQLWDAYAEQLATDVECIDGVYPIHSSTTEHHDEYSSNAKDGGIAGFCGVPHC